MLDSKKKKKIILDSLSILIFSLRIFFSSFPNRFFISRQFAAFIRHSPWVIWHSTLSVGCRFTLPISIIFQFGFIKKCPTSSTDGCEVECWIADERRQRTAKDAVETLQALLNWQTRWKLKGNHYKDNFSFMQRFLDVNIKMFNKKNKFHKITNETNWVQDENSFEFCNKYTKIICQTFSNFS